MAKCFKTNCLILDHYASPLLPFACNNTYDLIWELFLGYELLTHGITFPILLSDVCMQFVWLRVRK